MPTHHQFAPRASTYGSGSQGGLAPPTGSNNPLLMSTRKDLSQHGKTPLRAGSQSVRRGGTSVQRQTFLSGNWTMPKETRPIKDRAYQAMMQRDILDYLTQQRCPIPNLSMKTLQTPTNREFHLIFQFLITDIDPSYVFGREKKPEEEIMFLLRDLRYPLVDNISKTSLAAPGSSSAWPTLLAMLHWLVTVSQELDKWFDPGICQDYNVVPVDAIPLDVEIPNFPELIACDYVLKAYNEYMYGHDEFREQDAELENNVDQKNEAVIKRCDEKEMNIAKLKGDIAKLRATPGQLVALDQEYKNFQKDLTKITDLIQEKEAKLAKNMDAMKIYKEHTANAELEIGELNVAHEKILSRIASQGLTAEEVQQMGVERDKLERARKDLMPKVAESVRVNGELEIAVAKRADSIDQVVGRYTTLIYNTGLTPNPPEPFQDINFKLELNTAVSDPSEMLQGDMRNVIHPALQEIGEAKRKERAAVENERAKAEDELEVLTHECETMMENADPKTNQLHVLLRVTEEVRTTIAAETAAANAEGGQLERDLGQMEASVQQSEIALKSRKQRLQVEYADVVRKTEHLKEETRKKVTFECQQMLAFKQGVTKELESLMLYARDN
ncbi:kinetochore-associated Ndc80 complex subunit ndc80 [Tulasnella sp. 403]|nr:kinetochore-associated Ndc80 complex subunit ndc80 [Tulasnella sp. 403]